MFVAIFLLVVTMPLTGALRLSFFPDVPGDTVRAELTMQNDASYGQTHAALELLETQAYAADRQLRKADDDRQTAHRKPPSDVRDPTSPVRSRSN